MEASRPGAGARRSVAIAVAPGSGSGYRVELTRGVRLNLESIVRGIGGRGDRVYVPAQPPPRRGRVRPGASSTTSYEQRFSGDSSVGAAFDPDSWLPSADETSRTTSTLRSLTPHPRRAIGATV